jgi:hypothetical protein
MDLIQNVMALLDAELADINRERGLEDLPSLKTVEIKILGQMSLLMDPSAKDINPTATRDLDALIVGDFVAADKLRSILKSKGLVYDELSKEIWLPDNAIFIPYYSSENLTVSYLDPISALTSKAIKAREKNRFLIRRALEVFGKALTQEITRYGGDLNYFRNGTLEL